MATLGATTATTLTVAGNITTSTKLIAPAISLNGSDLATKLNTLTTTKIDTAGAGLTKDGTTLKHTNSITAGTYGFNSNISPTFGGAFSTTYVTFDGQGHITGGGTRDVTLPSYSGGTAITLSGTTFNHDNYGKAGTHGETKNESPGFGGTFTTTYITQNAQGHVTAAGTRTITLPNATVSDTANGLMTSTMKKKLDGIASGANKYVLPKATATELGGVKVGKNLSIDASGVLSAKDTTYGVATASSNGLMSSTDKTVFGSPASTLHAVFY